MCNLLDFGGPAMVTCSKVKDLPTLTLTIGGREFTLTPEQYILKIDAGRRGSSWGWGWEDCIDYTCKIRSIAFWLRQRCGSFRAPSIHKLTASCCWCSFCSGGEIKCVRVCGPQSHAMTSVLLLLHYSALLCILVF